LAGTCAVDYAAGMAISNAKKRAARRRLRPPLRVAQVLDWADAHFERTGKWPKQTSGRVDGTLEEKWSNLDSSLRVGGRGLPKWSSLARLLEEYRGKRNRSHLPPLTIAGILAWADAHWVRTGAWPTPRSGAIADAPGETWMGVQNALYLGVRGLPGGATLPRVLAEQRGVRNRGDLPRLTIRQILAWADAHKALKGCWPTQESGPIMHALGETWMAIEMALSQGHRALDGGTSLTRLLSRHRGVRNEKDLPRLTLKAILAWADAHHRRTGAWPTSKSGTVQGAPGETWNAVASALSKGRRGLPGGSSLASLLATRRGRRNRAKPPDLTTAKVLAWADEYYRIHGRWPSTESGPIAGAPGETWGAIDHALYRGRRGLAGRSSLGRFLAKHRAVRRHSLAPRHTVRRILAWADAYHARHGRWPTVHSGPITESPAENWGAVNLALRVGVRGLPGGSSLAKLLKQHRRLPRRSLSRPGVASRS
jgi:hypothetical protein